MATLTNIDRPSNPLTLSPLPYQHNAFANRDPALELIEERVREGRHPNRIIRQPVVLFWGVHGVGKSWLLSHLQRLYAFSPPESGDRRKGTFAALADLKDFTPESIALGDPLVQLAGQIAEHLGDEYLDPVAEAYSQFEQAVKAVTAGGGTRDVLASRFVELITCLTSSFVPVLLFDTVGQLESRHRELFLWLEEQIIAPLARRDRVIIVLASRRDLRRWRQFEVRRRIKTMELDPFDPQETVEQFRKAGVRAPKRVGGVIYPYSYGHPLATWHLQMSLDRTREEKRPFDREFIAAREQEVAYLLAEVEEWLLQGVPNELLPRLRLVATLRRFHIKSLQLLLSHLERDEALLSKPDSYFQDLIAELVATSLVRWSSLHHNYVLDPTVRRIMNRHLLLQNSDEFLQHQKAAFDLYAGWIEEMPWNCGPFVIEALYHLGTRAQASSVLHRKLHKEMDGLLAKALHADKFDLEGANLLSEEWVRDEELRETLGKHFDRVTEQVEDFHKSVKARYQS